MKKRVSFILAVIMLLAVVVPVLPVSAEEPTVTHSIGTAADLKAFLENSSNYDNADIYAQLTADIVFNDTTAENWYENPTNVSNGSGSAAFKGTFDGNGKTIYGFVTKTAPQSWIAGAGFLHYGLGATVKNLTLDGFYVCGKDDTANNVASRTGAIFGLSVGGTIDNCVLKNGTVTTAGTMTGACGNSSYASVGAMIGQLRLSQSYPNCAITNSTIYDSVELVGNGQYLGLIGAIFTANDGISQGNLDIAGSDIGFASCKTIGFTDFIYNRDNMLVKQSSGGNLWLDKNTTEDANLEELNTWADGSEWFAPNTEVVVESWVTDVISDAASLKAFLEDASNYDDANVYAKLTADIVFNDTTAEDWYENPANVSNGYGKVFKGTFDGNGKTISGFVTKTAPQAWVSGCGLFGYGAGATVKDLTLDGFYICGKDNGGPTRTGAFFGYASGNLNIDNCVLRNGILKTTGTLDAVSGEATASIGIFAGQIDISSTASNVNIKNSYVDDSVRIENTTGEARGAVGAVYLKASNGNLDFTGSDIGFEGCDTLRFIGKLHATSSSNGALLKTSGGNTWLNGQNNANGADVDTFVRGKGFYGLRNEKFVGIQLRAEGEVRFVGMVKEYATIDELGFSVKAGNNTAILTVTKVYGSILANNASVSAPEGYAYFTFVLKNVPENTAFEISSYSKTDDSATVGYAFTYTYVAP